MNDDETMTSERRPVMARLTRPWRGRSCGSAGASGRAAAERYGTTWADGLCIRFRHGRPSLIEHADGEPASSPSCGAARGGQTR